MRFFSSFISPFWMLAGALFTFTALGCAGDDCPILATPEYTVSHIEAPAKAQVGERVPVTCHFRLNNCSGILVAPTGWSIGVNYAYAVSECSGIDEMDCFTTFDYSSYPATTTDGSFKITNYVTPNEVGVYCVGYRTYDGVSPAAVSDEVAFIQVEQ